MTPPTPSAIMTFADNLASDTGLTPSISHQKGRRWRVEIASERVRMWVDYEVLSRGRLQWSQSQLFIDGQQAARATSYAGLLDIFRDPDGKSPEPPPQYIDVDPSTAPGVVRAMHARLAAKIHLLPGDFTLALHRAGRRWAIVISSSRTVLRYRFTTALMNTQRPERDPRTRENRRPLELEIDGVDVTAQVNGRLDKAIAMICDHVAAPPPAAIAGPSRSAVQATGVTVRKQTVLRL